MTSCIVGLQMGILLFVLPCVCSFFFLSRFFIKDISTPVEDRNFKFGMQVHNDMLYHGVENGLSPICSCICSFFFLSRFFIKDISTTIKDRNFKFGMQVHNDMLYRGLENGPSPICFSLYLFFFLSLQIFHQRYLHNRLQIWYRGSQRQVVLWDCKRTFSYYRIYPKYSVTVNIRTPSFFLKRHLFYVPYISGHVSNRVFVLSINVRTQITCPLFLIKLLFSLPEYFVYLPCLPVFPVSVVDKPLCPVCSDLTCVHYCWVAL